MSTYSMNTARNSDVARFDVEQLDEAKAVLDCYVESADPGMPGRFADQGMVRDQARRLEASSGIPFTMSVKKVQRALKRNATDADLVIDRVSMWVGETDGRPAFLSYPETPQIVFAALNRLSPNFRRGEREAFACYYTPFNRVREFTDRYTNVTYTAASDFYEGGYLGIVKWFGTCEEAFDAAAELKSAVETFQRDVTDSACEADVSDVELDDDGEVIPPIEAYEYF